MRVEFASRGLVCLTAMPPGALDLAALESVAQLGRPTQQVTNQQLVLAEYPRFRVLVTPDGRVQCDFASNADRDLCRTVATEIIRQVEQFGARAIGFNGITRIEAEDDEQPLAGLLEGEAVSDFLGQAPRRIGAKFVYDADDRARMTVDVSPSEDEVTVWLAAINRHYSGPVDDAVRNRGVSWLAAVNEELSRLLHRLPDRLQAR